MAVNASFKNNNEFRKKRKKKKEKKRKMECSIRRI